jgi:hypothetical protein
MRITSNQIISTLWGNGRPGADRRITALFFAARKAGLNEKQALAITCLTFDTVKQNVDQMSVSANALRAETLELKATDPNSPHSLWAYLRSKLAGGYRYITNEQIREASMNDYAGWSAWAEAARESVS